ncbi:uncharacterized protein LOC135398249 [Ornithodoros turicata]|uniref:uncharacterized protein LOC135398249 n=1 Tax=Ornithodoros turicata TaxID=34597 RepID=UPI003139EC54
MRNLVFLLVVLVYGTGLCLCQIKREPGCEIERIRTCGMDFVPYYTNSHLPETREEYAEKCKLYIHQVNCAENYTLHCIDGIPRAVALLGLRAALADHEESCNHTSPKYKVYIENVSCFNKAGSRLHHCINHAFASLQTAIDKAPEREKVNYACCHYFDLQDCFTDALKHKCDRPDVLDFFTEIMDHVFGDLLVLACGPYQRGSQECKSIPPLPISDVHGLVNIVEPLAALVQSFG